MKKFIALLLCASMLCAFVVIPTVNAQGNNGVSVCGIFDEEDEIYQLLCSFDDVDFDRYFVY